MNTKEETGQEIFVRWYRDELPYLHHQGIPLAAVPAFQMMGLFPDDKRFSQFKEAWQQRFGLQSRIPKHIEDRGWYLTSFPQAQQMIEQMRAGASRSKRDFHVNLADALLKRMSACYELKAITDASPALVQFEKRGDVKYQTVMNALLPGFTSPLHVAKSSLYIMAGSFCFADNTGRFEFLIN